MSQRPYTAPAVESSALISEGFARLFREVVDAEARMNELRIAVQDKLRAEDHALLETLLNAVRIRESYRTVESWLDAALQ